MIESNSAHVSHRRTNDAHERLVARRAEHARIERREPPFLPLGVELVGRGAYFHSFGEEILPEPSIGPAGIHADREIADERQLFAGTPELFIDEPL